MKLIVKVLQGNECSIEVESNETISDIKTKMTSHCDIPVSKQRILFLGKTLSDESKIGDHKSVKNGSKIYLVAKIPDPLDVALQKFFKAYFPQAEANEYATKSYDILQTKFSNMSWDDIERISKYYVEKDRANDVNRT